LEHHREALRSHGADDGRFGDVSRGMSRVPAAPATPA
jgi:hypothetical protein